MRRPLQRTRTQSLRLWYAVFFRDENHCFPAVWVSGDLHGLLKVAVLGEEELPRRDHVGEELQPIEKRPLLNRDLVALDGHAGSDPLDLDDGLEETSQALRIDRFLGDLFLGTSAPVLEVNPEAVALDEASVNVDLQLIGIVVIDLAEVSQKAPP